MPLNPTEKLARQRIRAFVERNFDPVPSDIVTGKLVYWYPDHLVPSLVLKTNRRGATAPIVIADNGDESVITFEDAIIILEKAGHTVPSVMLAPVGRPKLPTGTSNKSFSISADSAVISAFKALSAQERGELITNALGLDE
jgi:hypothetical protein